VGGKEDLNRKTPVPPNPQRKPLIVFATPVRSVFTGPARMREVKAHHEFLDVLGNLGVLAAKAIFHG
jgi:hypothetical protein